MLRRALRESQHRQNPPAALSKHNLPPEPPRRRETYYWRGSYYEVDENTKPEWIHAGKKATMPAPIAQMVVGQDQHPPASTRTPSRKVLRFADNAHTIDQHQTGNRLLDLPQVIRDAIYRLLLPTRTTITLEYDKGPPYVQCEPTVALVNKQIHDECLKMFYAENTFECPFHTTIYRWLMQMPELTLQSLRTVRLNNPLSHSGFVENALRRFNERAADGLRGDAVEMIVNFENAESVWVSVENYKQYEGLSGEWSGRWLGRRKVRKRKRTIVSDDEDDE